MKIKRKITEQRIKMEEPTSIIDKGMIIGGILVVIGEAISGEFLNMSYEIGEHTSKIYFCSFILFIYWIVLLVKYELDRKLAISNINEEELFGKYNPMLAGCFEGARDILPRDIIAVILNLVEKKYIKLEVKKNLKGNDNYKYYIEKVPHLETKMDSIEKFVYDWFFECGHYINSRQIDLIQTLKILPKHKRSTEKYELLNIIVQEKLHRIGANKNNVPTVIKITNVLIFIFSTIAIMVHIGFQNIIPELDIEPGDINSAIIAIIMFIVSICVTILTINLFLKLRDRMTKKLSEITEKKIITTIISMIFIFAIGIIILVICNVKLTKHLLADIVLLFITLIIMTTDDLMLKNNINRVEDFSRLQLLKEKIKNYTLLNEKDIEQIVLWEKYLVYAMSFGITKKIQNKIMNVELDDELLQIIRSSEFNTYIVTEYYNFYRDSNINPKKFKI